MRALRFVTSVVVFFVIAYRIEAKEIEGGTIALAGKFDMSMQTWVKTETDLPGRKTDRLNFSVSPVYYLYKNIGVGVALNANYTATTTDKFDTRSKLIAIGPNISYDLELSDNINVRINGLAEFTSYRDDSSDLKGYAVGGEAMLVNFLRNDISLDSGISYVLFSQNNSSNGHDVTSNGIEFFVGLTFYFN